MIHLLRHKITDYRETDMDTFPMASNLHDLHCQSALGTLSKHRSHNCHQFCILDRHSIYKICHIFQVKHVYMYVP